MMQGSYPKVQAVAAPEVDAAVVFDFNENGSWFSSDTLRDGWSLGSPARLAAAGDARTAWGPRRVAFSMRLRGSRSMAAQAQSTLARWLLQPSGWVLFQLDAMTPPVWIRMIGAEPQDLDFGLVHAGGENDIWDLGVSFDADPFLYGERKTLFSGTVPNDPTVAGGMVAPLGLVPGDAPMPLRVELSGMGVDPILGGALSDLSHTVMAVGGPAAGSPTNLNGSSIWVLNVGAGDAATNVHAQVTSVTGSVYAGGKARRMGFSASSGATAMANQFSLAAIGLPYGRYKMYALARSTASVDVTLTGYVGGSSVGGVPTKWINANQQRWVDLGEVTWPLTGHAPGMTGNGIASVSIAAARTSTTGALDISAIVLVPLVSASGDSTSSTLVSGPLATEDADALTLDSVTESAWFKRNFQTARSGRSHVGGWPSAKPGERSTLLFLRGVVQSGTPVFAGVDDASDTATITVTGQPQWLYLPSY